MSLRAVSAVHRLNDWDSLATIFDELKRLLALIGLAAFVGGILAFASYMTTGYTWDGGFPAGEVRLDVRDPDGKPVSGARWRIYHGKSRELAWEYPVENHLPKNDLVSDDDGRITAFLTQGGLQFGGDAWKLFWMIPMGAKAPEYDCEITAPGFKPLRFDIWEIFQSPHKSWEAFPKSHMMSDDPRLHEFRGMPRPKGEELVLRIYQNTFTLKR